jgi:hypothetical protein
MFKIYRREKKMNNENEKVYCKDCIYLKDYNTCVDSNNIRIEENWRAPIIKYKKSAEKINKNNNCKSYYENKKTKKGIIKNGNFTTHK